MTSSSSSGEKTCGICSGDIGQGQAIFTAECSHSFHFSCILNSGKHFCPVCNVKWNHLPFTMPISNTNTNPTTTFNNPFPFQFSQFPTNTSTNHMNTFNNPFPFHFAPFPPPIHSPPPQPQFPLHRRFEPEPLQFSDDEPLLSDPTSSISRSPSHKVAIKAVPELPALPPIDSVSRFTVLVGLKAPSLLDNARGADRAPIDLVTVLDVSGSMFGAKLALLKSAVRFVVDNLGPSDRLSIVSFSDQAWRMLPLRRMTGNGREDAQRAIDSLSANGGTNIVEGLKKGVRVLEERRWKNPVTSIIFLSDGNDTYNQTPQFQFDFSNPIQFPGPGYLHLLPASIYPISRESEGSAGELQTFPVHSFGFGSDHDPITMHAISDASGGTFSFIESYEMVQDAFAGCIGGLLSVVVQNLCLTLRSASHGVEIKSISSGRYECEISNQESQGVIRVGEMYADEEKEFLINLSIPRAADNRGSEGKTSLLDIVCCYKDVVSKERVQVEGELVEIKRSDILSLEDKMVNLEIDRQRNRLDAAESIREAQRMAEAGNLSGARTLLAKKRADILASASAQAGDGLSSWLEADMRETEMRMENQQMYQQSGRAFALSGMSSHASQRATTKGNSVAGLGVAQAQQQSFGGPVVHLQPQSLGGSALQSAPFCAYATPNMANMVRKSQQLSKVGEEIPPKSEE